MHQPGATEETKLHCLRLGSNPSLYEECILVKMKPVVLELVSLDPFRSKNDQRLAAESSMQARKWLSSLQKLHCIV